MVLEIFSRKACNFLCGSGFAPVWLNLWIFKTVVVIKSFPHWSQRPCFKAFFSCVSLTCYTSGKLVLINIFHVFHNFCVSKHVTFVAPLWQNLCIFRIVNLIKYFSHLIQSCVSCTSKHVTPGKLVSEIFSRKTRNFFCRSGPLCASSTQCWDKIFPALITKPKPKLFFSCVGLTRYISGKLVLETIFHKILKYFPHFLQCLRLLDFSPPLTDLLTHWLTQGVGAWRCYDI